MIRILALEANSSELAETELPLTDSSPQCSLRLRCLPGATAIHLALAEAGVVRQRAEVPADGGEEVVVRIALQDGSRLVLSSPGRHVLTLATDARYRPSPPLRILPPGAPLDLALVIDGTARSSAAEGGALLADAGAWSARVDQLVALVGGLVEGTPEARLALLAFGDDPPPQVRAEDLLPRYRLFPEAAKRRLRPLGLEQLGDFLLAIPATSGGDFVDAVADALFACGELRWRPEARKIVILSGDSPGHSILHPPPAGADAGVREHDVDDAVLGLHERGVEVVTLYHPPAGREELLELDEERELLDFAAAQYRRLASLPQFALQTTAFDPREAAAIVGRQQGFLGREATWGELVRID